MPDEEVDNRNLPNAPGQLLGYSLQFTRLTQLLLEKGVNWVLSLECLGDVAGSGDTGQLYTEEDKSSHTSNPVTDRSRDLWKTFHNWLASVERGEIRSSGTSFVLYVSRSVGGSIVTEFSDAGTLEDASEALARAKVLLWGRPPHFPLRASVAEGIAAYVEHVFEADQRSVCEIICNFELHTGSGSPTSDLRSAFTRLGLLPPELLDQAVSFATGWVKMRADEQLEASTPAQIAVEDFFAALRNFISSRTTRTVLRSVTESPGEEEIQSALLARVFIRQLEIIEESDEEKLQAVRDWWRSQGDCISWLRDGYVDPPAIEAFASDLVRRWEHEQARVPLLREALEDPERGRMLYRTCAGLTVPLDGIPVESHVVCGTYHDLADNLEVGWHPRFRELLGMYEGGDE